jgi:hypothetical protein
VKLNPTKIQQIMSSKIADIDPQKVGLLKGDPELEYEFIEKLGEG